MYAGKRFPALSLIFILSLSLLPLRSAQAGQRELLKSSVPSEVNLQPGIGGLVWNTFLGGAIEDDGKGIAVDGSGNVYITGWSKSDWGSPINPSQGGSGDAFVAKLDSSGNLIWNTFIGGDGYDYGDGVAVDGSGNIYVTGFAGGTWGTPVNSYAGGGDAFVTKLNSDGAVLWNTFLGGIDNDYGNGIAVDASGNTYVTGMSVGSWGRPVDDFAGVTDIFVAKLDSNGARVWHTFLGGDDDGSDGDVGRGIAVDGDGNVYVTGESPFTWGTPVNSHVDLRDVFVAKLDGSGNLIWNTFLGRNFGDFGQGIAIDSSSNIYVVGWSRDGSPGISDVLVARLNSSSGDTIWSNLLGESGNDIGYGIAVDGSGGVYIAGSSEGSWGSPVNPFAGGYNDAFIAELDGNGTLKWNTFLGGMGDDWSLGIAVGQSGNVYTTGSSNSSWGVPVNEFERLDDAFVAKLSGSSATVLITIAGNAGTDEVTLSYADGGQKSVLADSNGNYSFAVPYGWSGVVTPSKSGFTFDPESRTYENVQADQVNQDFTATLIPSSLSIAHVEVTQGIQDEKEPDQFPLVPLVEGKLTFVRVYLNCDINCPTGKVTGTIYGPNGENVSSHNKVEVKNVATWQSQRGDLGATLNFTLPLDWTVGNPTLTVQVEGTSIAKQARFIPTRSLNISYVPIREGDHEPDRDRINTAYWLAQKLYPTPKINYPYVLLPTLEWKKPWYCTVKKIPAPRLYHDCIVENLKTMLNNLYSNPYGDFLFGWLPAESDIADADPASIFGESDPGGHVAFGRDHQSEDAFIFAHEVGHLLGRRHTNKGDCGGVDPGTDWPYPSPNVFPNQTVWGLDGYGLAWRLFSDNSALKDPSVAYDYMSYCGQLAKGNVWTSPWTYKQILEELKISQQSSTTTPNAIPTSTTTPLPSSATTSESIYKLTSLPKIMSYLVMEKQADSRHRSVTKILNTYFEANQPYLIVSGVIFNDDTAAFDPMWIRTANIPEQNPSSGTTYCIEAQNAAHNALTQYCFDLDFRNYETGEASGADGFSFMLPYSTSIARIALMKGTTELTSREVSAHSPTVSVIYPNGGESWNATNMYTITWNANDSDGDSLAFNVYYSSDGLQWLPLGIDIPDMQLTIDASELPGSSRARVRVEVSDGVNTTTDESDTIFTVGSKAPQTTIVSPGNNEAGVSGTLLLFSGYSYDVEDGLLGDSSLSWSSSIDGSLGSGSSVLASLSPGQHTITLTATDSGGQTGSNQITINVDAVQERQKNGMSWFVYVILILTALMLIILGVTLPGYLQRKKVSSLTRLEGQADSIERYCMNCGTRLPKEGRFCHQCGTPRGGIK